MTERDIEAGSPAEADVEPEDADFSRTEGAHVLASQTKSQLTAEGFSEEQVLDWAETYVAEEGAGDVDAFLDWVEHQQSGD